MAARAQRGQRLGGRPERRIILAEQKQQIRPLRAHRAPVCGLADGVEQVSRAPVAVRGLRQLSPTRGGERREP